MRNRDSDHHALRFRAPREEARLELVSLAAEVATVAARVRERTGIQTVNESELEERCRTLEAVAARWLSQDTDFEQLSETGIADALNELRASQREAVLLMDFGGDAEMRSSVRALRRLLNRFVSRRAA
jgi:hypothetical protein